jgi:hypothetical protein
MAAIQDGYGVEIIGIRAQPHTYRGAHYVQLAPGPYQIRLLNYHNLQCTAQLTVDGRPAGYWTIAARSQVVVDRPTSYNGTFEVVAESGAVARRSGVVAGSEDNGLIVARFTPAGGRRGSIGTLSPSVPGATVVLQQTRALSYTPSLSPSATVLRPTLPRPAEVTIRIRLTVESSYPTATPYPTRPPPYYPEEWEEDEPSWVPSPSWRPSSGQGQPSAMAQPQPVAPYYSASSTPWPVDRTTGGCSSCGQPSAMAQPQPDQ